MPFTVEVDFEVYKELTYRRQSEGDSYNEVLRRLLGLKPSHKPASDAARRPWVADGVPFPHGSEFRLKHMGAFHFATVENGALVVDGQRFTSASRAAGHITRNSVNGWKLWWCKRPGDDDFRLIDQFRPQAT